MRTIKTLFTTGLMTAALAGCFTVHQTEYPQVQMTKSSEPDMGVQLSGFEATVTSYVPVYGYQTVWYREPGCYHHGRFYSGGYHPTTTSTTTYVPQTNQTTVFVERAQDALEGSGFVVNAPNARYRVEVKFSGPVVTDEDETVQALWVLLSALSANYSAQTWSAKLKIYEVATNKLVFSHDYSQKYSAAVWGPLPILSPAGATATDYNTMQSWCLTALTDRALADATAYLAQTKEP